MADNDPNIGAGENESKVCTKKCTIITVSVVAAVTVLAGIIVAIVLLIPASGDGKLMSSFTLNRRSLNRFRRDHKDNKICWDRRPDQDSFFNVIDTHNHFRPFGGPGVQFDNYIQWMQDAGILFSTMFGIGQLIKKKNPDDPDCCYYLHCPTLNYRVVPDPTNDRINAQEFTKYKQNEGLKSKIHLTLSATFPNLQRPENITRILGEFDTEFPGAFRWAGEVNVIKHALVGNGFFDKQESPRITKRFLDGGKLDDFFRMMEDKQWPVTIHCDCGCDNYNAIPAGALDNNPVKGCDVPAKEIDNAQTRDNRFWRDLLGPFYHAFFYSEENKVQRNSQNFNRPNLISFRKVQHLILMDTILQRYPRMKVVWAHMCLNKELLSLHPRVHTYIMEKFLTKYKNLYVDLSWDVLSKMLLLNYNDMEGVDKLSTKHPDIHAELAEWNSTHLDQIHNIREAMHEKWEQIKDTVHSTGSHQKLNGPTHAFVVYLDLFEKFPDRFLPGTDFVSSMAEPELYPGMKQFKEVPSGCMKDEANHRRQVTDTSAVNIFFKDEVFRKVVLGENYFKLVGLQQQFVAPKVCS